MFFLRIMVLKVDSDLMVLSFLVSFAKSDGPKYIMECLPFVTVL